MATDRLGDNDWVEAEIARQLEQVSLDDENDEEADIGDYSPCRVQVASRNTSPQAAETAGTLNAHVAYSVFKNYIETLSNEHTVVDNTLLEAQNALAPSQSDQLKVKVTHSSPNASELTNTAHLDSFKHFEVTEHNSECGPSQDVKVQPEHVIASANNIESVQQNRTDNVSNFKEETEEVKSTVENFKLQQLQQEEELSRKLHQREADINAMIKESIEKRRKQEEVIAQRARMDETRRNIAVVSLQAGVRGYLTRKKITPKLVALREMKRLERERERERIRTKAAISIQAIWKGYRSRINYQEALLFKREAMLKKDRAATLVQTWWRGKRARRLFIQLKEDKVQQQLLRVHAISQHGSDGKLTVAMRIQSSLNVMKQSSLSELASSAILDSLSSEEIISVEHEASGTCTNKQQVEHKGGVCTPTSTSPKSPTPHVRVSSGRSEPHTSAPGDLKSPSNVPGCALPQQQSPTMLLSQEIGSCSESPQNSVCNSVSKVNGSGSVVRKLARSLSESDRKSLIFKLQHKSPISSSDTEVGSSNISKQELLPKSKSNQPAVTSLSDSVFSVLHQEKSQSETTSTPTRIVTASDNKTMSALQPLQGTCTSRDDDNVSPVEKETERKRMSLSHNDMALVEEQRALALLVERREAEEMVAQLSRQRMNSLLSEEELAEVAKRKRSHSTYRQELEYACTPLLPHAWLGVIEERVQEWKKHHKKWNPPANIQRKTPNLFEKKTQISTTSKSVLQSRSSVGHFSPNYSNSTLRSVSLSPTGSQFNSATKSLSDAQLLAASPHGTKLDEVACVMLYRSRGDVSIPDIGRRCRHVSSLCLTKCGAMTMVEVEREEVGGVWEELVELNLQSNMMERVDCNLMKELRFVDISDNRLASIHGLDNCPYLLELCLSDNRVARVSVGGLPKCSGLQVFDIDSNLLINCKGLEDLPLLQRFSCAENHLPKVDGLTKCSLLQYLRLSQNNLQLHPNLCDHVLLRELYLDENSLSDITAITKSWLPLLQTLSLSNNCIMELSSLTCLVMLKTLDISNNSIYDLPLLLQSLRGCLQLQTLHLHGNPVTEESKFCTYISRTLHSLSELDGESIAKRNKRCAPLIETIKSSPIYQLCCRQLEEQDQLKEQQQMELEELKFESSHSPSPENTRKILMTKISHCHSYEKLLIQHLREQEAVPISRNKASTNTCNNTNKKSSEDRILELRVKAAIVIQALVRGWLARRRIKMIKQHNAATNIQAHYRGYLLRRRLREILERAHGTVNVDQRVTVDGSGDDDELEFEEEVLGLDYLDETLLDADVKPLSPTNEHLIKYTTSQSLQNKNKSNGPPKEHDEAQSQPLLVPIYSLPGAATEEVTFETWKKQQHDAIPANRPVHIVPSHSHQTTQHWERDCQTHGESSPVGYSETDSDVYSTELASCERTQPIVQQAWGSQTQLHVPVVGGEVPVGCNSSITSSTTEVSDTMKKEKIVSDWGFQSSTTADLMMKRMQRQKKLHSNAVWRQKLYDPDQRLALFHKHKNQVTESDSSVSMKYTAKHRHHSAHATQNTHDVQKKEHSLFQWVHEQHLVHKGEGTGFTKGTSSFLPSMESHVLAGHKPRLITSAHQNELVESSLNRYEHKH